LTIFQLLKAVVKEKGRGQDGNPAPFNQKHKSSLCSKQFIELNKKQSGTCIHAPDCSLKTF
jgi:hypothetical protein